MDNFGLSQQTIFLINNLFAGIKEIETVKIFGSRAKGNFKPNSDIDFVIYGNCITDKLIRHISSELEELSTPYRYDVVAYSAIDNEDLIKNIDKDGRLFYKRCTKS